MAEQLEQQNLTAQTQVPATATPTNVVLENVFGSSDQMNTAWKMATLLSKSSLIPENFRGKPEDTIIAIDYASRTGVPPFAVLQQMYIVHGKPGFSSQFLIGCINSCGRFTPMNFKKGEKGGVIAYAKSKATGETLESPEVTLEMASAEGWASKPGSKWKTMPELMMRYRAATFFARLFAPDITYGIRTTDELADIGGAEASPTEKKQQYTIGE